MAEKAPSRGTVQLTFGGICVLIAVVYLIRTIGSLIDGESTAFIVGSTVGLLVFVLLATGLMRTGLKRRRAFIDRASE